MSFCDRDGDGHGHECAVAFTRVRTQDQQTGVAPRRLAPFGLVSLSPRADDHPLAISSTRRSPRPVSTTASVSLHPHSARIPAPPCLAAAALPSTSPASATAPALATWPTSSNGTSSRAISPNAVDIVVASSFDLDRVHVSPSLPPSPRPLHARAASLAPPLLGARAPAGRTGRSPSPFPHRTAPTSAISNTLQGTVALSAATSRPRARPRLACEYLLACTRPHGANCPAASLSSSTRAVAMPMMPITRCTTSASAATTC